MLLYLWPSLIEMDMYLPGNMSYIVCYPSLG